MITWAVAWYVVKSGSMVDDLTFILCGLVDALLIVSVVIILKG